MKMRAMYVLPQTSYVGSLAAAGTAVTCGDQQVVDDRRRPTGGRFGLLIAEAPDQFLLVGQGASTSVVDEVDSAEEGRFESGRWVPAGC
jgi:hypothetical protein